MKFKASSFINILLPIISIIVAVLIAEIVLLSYEKHCLKTNMPQIGKEGYIDLNALNYNESGVDTKKSLDEFRILCFGDSFCYSIMRPEYSYCGLIQQHLNEADNDLNYRVVNLGEPATSMNDYMGAYSYWSQIIEHDAVIFNLFLGNDLLDIAYAYVPPAWVPNRYFGNFEYTITNGKARLIPHKFPLRLLDYLYARYLMIKKKGQQDSMASAIPGPEYNLVAGDGNNLSTKVFKDHFVTQLDNFSPDKLQALAPAYNTVYDFMKFISEVKKSGKKVLLTLGPNEGQVNYNLRNELAKEYGLDLIKNDYKLSARIIKKIRDQVDPEILILDMVEAFQSQYAYDEVNLFYKTNTHWGKEGNELAGLLIGDSLITNWFGEKSILPDALQDRWNNKRKSYEPIVSDIEIETYLKDLLASQKGLFKRIDYLKDAHYLFDGITDDPSKYACGELHKPISFLFNEPRKIKSLDMYLYNFDGRYYKFTIECLIGDKWKKVFDGSSKGNTGFVNIKIPNKKISAFKITGLYNSDMKMNPANKMIHIMEIKLETTG